ncbi:MAG: hypothetical protein ACPGD8_07725, partial [Flavobacteriales bacterium]
GVDFGGMNPQELKEQVWTYSTRFAVPFMSSGMSDEEAATLITQITTDNNSVTSLPPLVEMYASRYSVPSSGDQAVLIWTSDNAEEVSIDGIGVVESSGTHTVTITGNTTFTITAVSGGQSVSASVDVVLGGSCDPSVIENSDSTVTISVASGETEEFPDTPIKANGDLVVNQPSGVEQDIVVRYDTLGTVATTIDGGEIVIPDAVAGGDTLTITVKNQDGDVIETANFGDEIDIEISTTLDTPTAYRFFINNQTFIQPSNTLSYTVNSFDDITIHAEAEDGSSVAAALDATTITINADADANAFIAAHNSASGNTMASHQQEITQGFFQRLKGVGTTYGENIWSIIHANSNSRMQILMPVSDSVVKSSAYAIDCIHLGSGTYYNFLPSNYSTTGVIGGASKYFDIGVPPNAFNQDDFSQHVYVRTDIHGALFACGSSEGTNAFASSAYIWPKHNNKFYHQTNSNDQTGVTNTDSRGFYSTVRSSSTKQSAYKNGALISEPASTSNTPSSKNTFFHGLNGGGALKYPHPGSLCFYAQLPALTANQVSDLYEAVQWLQTNIITGGRDV